MHSGLTSVPTIWSSIHEAIQRHVDLSSGTGKPCNSSLGRPSSDHLKEMLRKNGQPLWCFQISCILKASSSNLLNLLLPSPIIYLFHVNLAGLWQVYAPQVLVQLLGLLLTNSAFINQKLHHVDTLCARCFQLHCLTPPFLP